VFPLIRSTGMITLGSEHHSIDFEAVWRERMQVPENHDHLVGSHEGVWCEVTPVCAGSLYPAMAAMASTLM